MASTAKRPWYMFYPLAGMILLSLAWCGYWFFAFSAAKELIQAKRLEFAGNGMELTCARESWDGFPFRFEFQCETATLHFIHTEIQTTKILAVAQAYNPLHVIVLVDGPTSIDRTTVTHDRALISIKINTRLDLAADTTELTVIRPDNPPITVSSAELVGHTSGQTLEISRLKISKGPVDFAATGTVSLDAQHRLAGRLSSQTNDIDGVMKFIEPIFALNEQDRITITNLVTQTGSDPATKTTKADFIARDGALYWGLIKLADLTPLY
jgi:hypothetical protein